MIAETMPEDDSIRPIFYSRRNKP